MVKMYAFLTEMIYVLVLAVLPVTAIALSIIFADNHCKHYGVTESHKEVISSRLPS